MAHTMTVRRNPLEAWRAAKGMTYAELGAAIGVSSEAARRYCIGLRRMPRPAVMARIRELTDGAVTADSFLPAAEDSLL